MPHYDGKNSGGKATLHSARINTNSAPRGVSKSTSGLPAKTPGEHCLYSARINTNSAPRGVSKSSSGLAGKEG